MTQINPNMNEYKVFQPNFKSAQSIPLTEENLVQDVQLPDIYYVPEKKEPKTLVETVKQADMMGMVYPWLENPLLMAGTCLALSKGIDKFTESCSGDYEKTLLGKATKLGDNIENSAFMQKPNVKKVTGGINGFFGKVNNLLNKSSLIRAIRYSPEKAEWTMPLSEMMPQEVRILEDFSRITETLRLTEDGVVQLKDLGLNKEERNFAKTILKGSSNSKVAKELTANLVLLKRLGKIDDEIFNPEVAKKLIANQELLKRFAKTDVEIFNSDINQATKNAILDTLGLTVDDLKDIKANPKNWIKRVRDIAVKTGEKVKIGAGHYDWLGPVQPLEREISMGQIGNRLHSLMDGAKTKTGRFFAAAIQKIHRGFTFGGGKLGMCLFIAPSFVQMMKNTVKADKDQKVGTVAFGSIEAISWVFTFPLAIASAYHLGGMRNAGISPDNVKKAQELRDNFNKLVDDMKLTDPVEYQNKLKEVKQQIKDLRKVDKQNLFTKTIRKITSFFYADLNYLKTYKNGNGFADALRKLPNTGKNFALVPLRFMLCMFGFETLYRKCIEKATHTIFGNHYDHYKEEEIAAAKKEQKEFTKKDLQERLYNAQAKKLNAQNNPQAESKEVQNTATTPQRSVPEVAIAEKIKNPKAQEAMLENVGLAQENIKKPQTNVVNPQTKTQASDKVVQTATNSADGKYIPNPNPDHKVLEQAKNVKRDNYTYIPSSENVIKKEQEKNNNSLKYIPSQAGAKFTKTFDNSGLESALRRADRAEQKALQVLSGNFNG